MNNKIYEYIDNRLSKAQRGDFELELENSPVLREELYSIQHSIQKINDLSASPDMDSYFAEARVRFHSKRMNTAKSMFFSNYAFAGSGAFSLAFMLFFGLVTNLAHISNQNLILADSDNLMTEVNILDSAEPELFESAVTADARISDEFDKNISDRIGIEPENSESLISELDISTDELAAGLQFDEIDRIIPNKLTRNRAAL